MFKMKAGSDYLLETENLRQQKVLNLFVLIKTCLNQPMFLVLFHPITAIVY